MGAFDFAGPDPEKLTQLVNDEGLDIQDLNISVEGEAVTISGTAASEDVKAAALNLLKGTEGVSEVKDYLKVASGDAESGSAVGSKTHVVQYGDTLWGISEKYYGDGSQYMKIFEANKELWKNYNYDPNVIYPNWELTIP
jgi:nucleoid-associated protein YgaU